MTIDAEVKAEILRRLKSTEEREGVRILMAVESGSRAWGFASPNSDYDVRFVYTRTEDWYLSLDLEDKRDVIEYPIVDEIDLNGWDIRKALRLYWKSNPAFVEWIQSPITYVESGCFKEECRSIMPDVYSLRGGLHHYLNMARNNHRGHLTGAEVVLKKYFYVLRPLLAIRWIEKFEKAPPIEFSSLLPLVENDRVLSAVHDLVEQKRRSLEKSRILPVQVLDDFISQEFQRLSSVTFPEAPRRCALGQLNGIFRKVLGEGSR